MEQRKELYHFAESNDQGYEFPTPGLEEREITGELRKDAALSKWLGLYGGMFVVNQRILLFSEEREKDYNSFDNYTKVYDLYMQTQKVDVYRNFQSQEFLFSETRLPINVIAAFVGSFK